MRFYTTLCNINEICIYYDDNKQTNGPYDARLR